MDWTNRLTSLADVLASLYQSPEASRRVIEKSGLRPELIEFSSAAAQNWFNILVEARRHNAIGRVVSAALQDYPENVWLQTVATETPAIQGVDIRTQVGWRGLDKSTLEKITGSQSTLLPVCFLETGVKAARSVARVVTRKGVATGFLVAEDLFLTCNHVIPSIAAAEETTIEFNYQLSSDGLLGPHESYSLVPSRFFVTEPEKDCTIVAVEGTPGRKWGNIEVRDVRVDVGDFVNIVQHPGGGPKQLGLYHNTVVALGEDKMQYLTDTLPGASGAPVFDSNWHVVAVHHSGGWLQEPATGHIYFRNEGIDINAIRRWMAACGLLNS